VRPATPLICQFIDAHRDRFGVVSLCLALAVHGVQIAIRNPLRGVLQLALALTVLFVVFDVLSDGFEFGRTISKFECLVVVEFVAAFPLHGFGERAALGQKIGKPRLELLYARTELFVSPGSHW